MGDDKKCGWGHKLLVGHLGILEKSISVSESYLSADELELEPQIT
jgi:hypothetical protein